MHPPTSPEPVVADPTGGAGREPPDPGAGAPAPLVRHGSRGRLRVAAVLVPVVLVTAAGGYAVADARDLVPGVLTTEPLPLSLPLPVAPGTLADPPAARTLPTPSTAPAPDPAVLAAAVGPLLASPALGPSVGASVLDAETGAVLLDVAAGAPLEPASTVKLLTAAAVLHRLGAATTLPTRVTSGAAPDQVVLVGGGDALLAEGAGDPSGARGRAGLADLAAGTAVALRSAGTTSVVVLVDDTLTGSAPQTSPAWSPSDLAAGFVAPVTALAVDAGRLAPERYAPRTPDPALAAAVAFAQRLREQGVTVPAEPVRGSAPPGAVALAEVRSAPLADVVALTLAESDNTVADTLAHLVRVDAAGPAAAAAPSTAAAGAEVLVAVAELGVDTTGTVLADGSGLGEGSRVPAAALAGVLAAAASPDAGEVRALLPALPVAGLSGTLSGRFRAEGTGGGGAGTAEAAAATAPPAAGAGVVRAKSGSLQGVTSLAGSVVDADGRHLVFAVVADQVASTEQSRRAVDAYAAALAGCGCR